MVVCKVIADIGGAEHRDPIGDAALGCGTGEAVRMADDPVGHITTIAAAGDADPLGVDLRVLLQNYIRKFHQIFVINGTVFAPDVSKLIASAIAAAGITEEYKITHVSPKLHLMEEYFPVSGFGATVNVQNRRVALLRIEVLRFEHPAPKQRRHFQREQIQEQRHTCFQGLFH